MQPQSSSHLHSAPSNDHPRVVVASDYKIDMQVWNGLIYEIASLTAAFHGTEVINALGRNPKDQLLDWLLRRRLPTSGLTNVSESEPCDLFFYVCNFPRSLVALKSLTKVQRRAKKSVAFLIETWSSQAAKNKRLFKALDNFDHVFLCNETSVAAVQSMTTAHCSYLPAAIDTLAACSYPCGPERLIDAFAMGRCEEGVHEDLKEQSRLGRLFYFFENFPNLKVKAYAEARERTYNLINRSKLFLCFNHDSGSKAQESKGEAAIPNRIFEGIGAGGVLIGTAPRTKSFASLFDWEDAFIEAPLDPAAFRSTIADLLADDLRLRKAALRNMTQSLQRLDWVYRWETVLKLLGMEITPVMMQRKAQLSAMATLVERDLVSSNPVAMLNFG